MITLTTEQAQQIEEALVATTLNKDYWLEKCMDSLDTIRAARAQEPAEQEPVAIDWDKTHEVLCDVWNRVISADDGLDAIQDLIYAAPQPVSQEYQDHLVNQSFDWAAMAAKHQFMECYRIGLAEMREKCAKVCDDIGDSDNGYGCAAAIRAINFEGDTGFRPVSEMIAEHKQDLKKAAAIEKAKMRKAEQEPVAERKAQVNELIKESARLIASISDEGDRYLTAIDTLRNAYRLGLKDAATVRTKDLTDELQQKCSDWGAYWRAPDAHGVNLYIEQATELLRDALGVEVEITPPVRTKDLTDDEIAMILITHIGKQYDDFARAVIAADREKNK